MSSQDLNHAPSWIILSPWTFKPFGHGSSADWPWVFPLCNGPDARQQTLSRPGSPRAVRCCPWSAQATTVAMPQQPTANANDARQALADWLAAGHVVQSQMPPGQPDVIIDGLFGIGLTRALEDPWQRWVDAVNALGLPVLSLDVPSGIHADRGDPLGRAVQATWTLAFIAPSLASVAPGAKRYFGECHVASLGIPT